MKLPMPLLKGRFLKRYKRFFADVELEGGEIVTAHCANPGSMLDVAIEGAPAYVSVHDDPKRKLKFSWAIVKLGDELVPINTTNPNKIVEEAINARKIKELEGYTELRREVKYGTNSRIDILLEHQDRAPCYVEIKNVHLVRQSGLAEFPDSVTARGRKHLLELEKLVSSGIRAVMLFLVQRSDCTSLAPARDLDPAYAEALDQAHKAGVEILCYDCAITPPELIGEHKGLPAYGNVAVTLRNPLPIRLEN